ncbi:MAG: dihydrofolate synthase [Spirochaetae bacterium HGW-Spirochaetae-5]|nr:MAG: dihydrofolate synthase [Spirochaetae bacterium HGW-Spirochaetae-5]
MINDILNKYLNNEKKVNISNYSLDGIISLLSHLKNPQKNFKSLHIAGTNGKGSTAFMIASILQKSGYKTGLYISPHLHTINERIKINLKDIDEELLYRYISEIDRFSDSGTITPTYFDVLTAAAFKYFSDENVDIAVIETGLGGRLDSTNIIIPEISVITDISLDHVQILGNSIEAIAREKCGIIKPGIPVVTSNTRPEILTVIAESAVQMNSELTVYNRDFFTNNIIRENEYFQFDYNSGETDLPGICLSLFPIHQVKNSALAITAVLYLQRGDFSLITQDIIYSCLKDVEVPGRFQKLCLKPFIVFDPAHNFESLNNLFSGLEVFYPGKKKKIILSLMKDKAENQTLNLFKNSDTYYYILDDERAFIPEPGQFKKIIADENIILEIIRNACLPDEMIIFTGSFRIYTHALNIASKFKQLN